MTKAKERKTPWRDNLEAMAMAVVVALLLKYFLVEAYKIPTGSMQPTLMGNQETGIFDRILVDKLSFHFRDPERWEVCVFRYPLKQSQNFVKRVVGVGPEQLRIHAGDLWNRDGPDDEWTVLRRPRPVQGETWKNVDLTTPSRTSWTQTSGAERWAIESRSVRATGSGTAAFREDQGTIRDDYQDGYPDALRDEVRPSPGATSGTNDVGDLRLEGSVTAEEGCETVLLELCEGQRRYSFVLPGPAAPAGARAAIRVLDRDDRGREIASAEAEAPFALEAGEAVRFGVQNLDDLLELDVDGEIVCGLEVASEPNPRSAVSLGLEGSGALFEDLMVQRDIYYTTYNAARTEVTIPAAHYFMLGDNTQDSSDSRAWNWVHFRVQTDEGERILRGNHRPASRLGRMAVGPWRDENPYTASTIDGRYTWFWDENGERWRFPPEAVEQVPAGELGVDPASAGLVPRRMMLGRALAVFWPISLRHRLARLQWVH